jgi:hypothetical protein
MVNTKALEARVNQLMKQGLTPAAAHRKAAAELKKKGVLPQSTTFEFKKRK